MLCSVKSGSICWKGSRGTSAAWPLVAAGGAAAGEAGWREENQEELSGAMARRQ